ncbi:DUF642 domain-containing protein [Luteolibacter luteus]|uniref:DUF642 domain-containing protein n=1 Tax=Luteolibacter luteus TaxID=2728835 RepID=A0A858RI90_9BACT|nr:DUF642 domain-containing protein [Luteolibacter luteus]QJE96916.1 DUF642 domain-containing protein [Luteolibacter luteus]
MSSSPLITRRTLYLGALLSVCAGTFFWAQYHRQVSPGGASSGMESPRNSKARETLITGEAVKSEVTAREADTISPAVSPATPAVSRELNIATNPYAAGLKGPGKSKRAWDERFIQSFSQAKEGDPVRFELTEGVVAEGVVKIVQSDGAVVSYVSGELSAPEKGKFFFITPPEGGKAGKAVGVVEFPGSETAYRIEPTGANGEPELWQRRLDEVVCMGMAEADPAMLEEAKCSCGKPHDIVPLRPDQVPDYVPEHNDEIISLQSYPGSQAVMLLDFAGGYTSGWGGVTYARPNVSNEVIKDIWKRVAEDYMPFNINVTTDINVFLAAPAASRQRCCYTTTPITPAGVAYFGSWNWGNDTVCWSVYNVGKAAAEVGSHEVGHTLGLAHQGQNGGGEYYGGHGGGETGWAPIMGVGYYQAVTTWAKGEYSNANQQQDQLQTITTTNNNVGYRNDDTGSTLATSRYLEIKADNTISAEGVIERTADTDAFQFTTTGGAVSLRVDPVAPGDWGNLATMATLADASGNVLATANAQDDVSSTITTTLAAGTYTFRVTGAGKNDPLTNGFTDYGSLGYYAISGSVAGARQPTRLSVAERAPNNTIVGNVPANNPNSSALVYTITGGNTGGTFSISTTGVLQVANNALLDYHALAATPSLYAAQFELFVTITNLSNGALTETNRRVVVSVDQLYAPVPAGLAATLDSSLRIRLEWGESNGATGYLVKRSTTSGGPYTSLGTVSGTSYSDASITHGVTYYYVVTAVNANGESNNSAEARALGSSVAGGFESPRLSSGTFRYSPTGNTGGWTFGGGAGNGSGIATNGSAFGSPTAPEGSQVAFIQSYGTLTQTFSGFTPGTQYRISYLAAQRGSQSGQTWNLVVDGNVLQSNPAGSTSFTAYGASFTATLALHTLSFVGTNLAGGDNTVFIDNVQIATAGPTIPNFSFEAPALGGGSGAYRYNPTGGSWTFNGTAGNGSGIAGNGSAFGTPDAPHGSQVAFIQQNGTITQTLTGFTAGKAYTLNYLAAQRGGSYGGQTWDVKIGSSIIQSNNVPGSTSFTSHTANFVATGSSQTLSFVGTNINGGDRSVFIDNVSITPRDSLSTVLPVVALTSPANDTVFPAYAPVNLTASVTANGNAIDAVQFFVGKKLIGEIGSAPYTCAWGNVTGGRHTAFARVLFNDGSIADSAPLVFVVAASNLNLGFEAPSLGGGHQYTPAGASWKFTATGIAANGSSFNNPNAPEGSQVGFVQFKGTTTQIITGFIPGTSYTISYAAAQRPGNQQTWDLKVDGAVIQSYTGGSSTFSTRTASFTATAGYHELSFEGTNLNGGDNTIFIDNISFNPPLQTSQSPVLVADTSPATTVDVVGSEVRFVAAFGSALPTAYQWQKIVNGQATNIAGATSTTLTLSSLQLADAGYYRLQATNSAGVSVSAVSQLTVNAVPAAVDNVITSYAAQTGLGSAAALFQSTWEVVPGSLIASKAPSETGNGNFTNSTNVLTDGSVGRSVYGSGGATASQVTCGSSAGQSVTYNLGTASGGYSLSGIVVYGGWPDAGRDQQAYTVSYSTVSSPTVFTPLAEVDYNPENASAVQAATRSTIRSATAAPLASSVAALRFDFANPEPENGYCGYTEIAVYGTPAAPVVTMQTSPATATDVVGGQVSFTASVVGAAPLSYQWQKVVGGVPSNISGATSPMLTLSNLQTSDAASYQLRVTNAQGNVTTAAAKLTVNNVPAAVNNVITSLAAQTGLGGNTTFEPSWKLTADDSVIRGMMPSTAAGNFSLNSNGRTLAALTTARSLAISPTTGGDNSINYLSGGNGGGAGASVIYMLPAGGSGYSLTKIIVHGGWSDAGRDQQAYTVSYSKVATPTTFVPLGSVNYNPSNPSAVQSTTRSTLTAANGILATNVAALKFDFTNPGSENGWVGYAQLAVHGVPTLSAPINLIATAGDAQASLSWAATPGATTYNVKRSTVSGGPYSTVGNVSTTSFVNTGLSNGTPYYYVVTALNAGGETGSSGQVSVTPIPEGYDGWLAAYPSLTGPDRLPDADPDGDGMPNGVEFMTGTSPENGSGGSPIASHLDSSGNLVLTFKRVDAAKDYTIEVDSATELGTPWTSVVVSKNAISSAAMTVVENGSAPDDVTVVIPANGEPKKFARVRITIP